jgi:hypothetical protein
MSDTPMTDACFEAAQVLIRKYGTRDGVGPDFRSGAPWLLARRLEIALAECRDNALEEAAVAFEAEADL